TEPVLAESLRLDDWMSISGAAFTTGIGMRTSRALSLLAGIFNVRLGYWWDSGIDPSRRESWIQKLSLTKKWGLWLCVCVR
ncbi:MAG TPA: hypothetical protein VGY66_14720, partial [Gemmataceae bacterium]|nr:hypothetical protein [Gemmataceae bacterium]